MTVNLTVRRADVQDIIDEDPWDVDVYREGATPDDAEITFDCVGRIQPSGARGAPRSRAPGMTGESPRGTYGWVLLAPYDTTALLTGDQITATQQSTGTVRKFTVAYSGRYSYKHEAILDDRQ